MASCQLYEDLSGYYDQFCHHIPYAQQAQTLYRLTKIFNDAGGVDYLDIACGTGQLMEHTQNFGWQLTGLDLSGPMLQQAALRIPAARFLQMDMASLPATPQYDFASCLLYSIHYNTNLTALSQFFQALWRALKPGGFVLFDCVDKRGIDNSAGITTYLQQGEQHFTFTSAWQFAGFGNKQSLQLSIKLMQQGKSTFWQDEHCMVAVDADELTQLLGVIGFQVTFFERNFEQLIAWGGQSFNLLVVAQKPLDTI